jgi:hypothetical protein
MSTLKSIVASNPRLRKVASRVKSTLVDVLDMEAFHTLSPDALVALVKAFNLHKEALVAGQDLFRGHAYYEFGLYKGFSFWFAEQISREYAEADFRCLGFDSFEGLPQPQLAVEARAFGKGDFRGTYEVVTGNLRQWKTDFSRIALYKGFYSDEFFAQLRAKESFPKVSICLIDADLYESCVPVLEFIKPNLVEGSILLFDDYNQLGQDDQAGERRALIEFENCYPTFKKEHLFDYGWEGAAFRVVAV